MSNGWRTDSLTLRDGRRLAWHEFGASEGRAVIYLHGLFGSGREGLLGHQAALERGVRLIAPDRPGHGGSSPLPGMQLSHAAGDIAALSQALKLERYALIGLSAGGPHALAAAAGNSVPVAVVCGAGPRQVPGGTPGRGLPTRLIYAMARWLPPLLYLMLWVLRAVVLRLSAPMLERMTRFSPRTDREALGLPHVGQAFLEGWTEGLRQGVAGAFQDARLITGPWVPEKISTRVHLWYGALDPLQPPSVGQYLLSTIPGAQLNVVADEGHLLLGRHFGRVLEALLAEEPGSE